MFTKYLIGEIRADFLDADDDSDIVTSDRQRLKEDDPRYVKLIEWFKEQVLSEVEGNWSAWRREQALDVALENDAVNEWYQTLSSDNQHFAKQLFGKIGKLGMEDESGKKELYRNTILAFERLRLRESLTELAALKDEADLSVLTTIFDGIDELEAVEYHGISKGRLEVIEAFSNIVQSEKERVIQYH